MTFSIRRQELFPTLYIFRSIFTINSTWVVNKRTRALTYASLSPYLPIDTKEMFKTTTEDNILSNIDQPDQKRLKNYLTDILFANIMLHSDLFTNSLQNVQVFKEIIIPSLSNSFNSNTKLFKKIISTHDQFKKLLEQEINRPHSIIISNNDQNETLNSTQKTKQASFNINLKKIPTIDTIKSLISFVSQSVPLPLKFFKNYVSSLSPIEDRIFEIFDTFSNDLDFLFYCYLWGIATGSIELLLKTAYSSFLLSINDNKNQKVKSIKYDQDFYISFRSESAFYLPINKRTGFINLNDFLVRSHYQKSTFCVSDDQLFLINANSILTNISLSETLTDRSERFSTTKFELTQSRTPAVLTISNGFLYIGLTIPLIYSIKPFRLIKSNPSYSPKNSPHIKPPLASDGFYIYSLISKSEIAVFSIEGSKINCTRIIKLKVGNSSLLIPHNEKLISKKWLKNATTVTDGFTFRIILADGEPGRIQHFIRSFSLIDGMHIGDQKVVYQFLIHSISYDPYSNSYYVLTPFSEGSQILRFDNVGTQPPWIADISLNSFPINQSLQKVFESTYVKPISLSINIFTILQYFTIPLMGCEPNSPAVNQNTLNYLTYPSKSNQIINMILESIAAINMNVSPFQIDLKSENIESAMKALLILLSLNISRHDMPFDSEESQKITTILPIILTKNRCYRSTVFFLLINNFEKLFESCPETISDVFAIFQSDLTTHELMLLNNLSKSILFPYLFSEKMYPMFYTTRIQRIRKINQVDPIELTFILRFQHSLFVHEDDDTIIKYCSALSTGMFEQMIFMLKEIDEYDEKDFSSNAFVQVYRKFLLLIQLKISNYNLVKSLIQYIQPLMKSFTECLEKIKEDDSTSSMLFQCFIESFDMCTSFFSSMVDSKFNFSKANKFIHIIQAINYYFIKNQNKDNESDVDEIDIEKLNLNLHLHKAFKSKFSKHKINIETFMDYYYENVKNPMNKSISKEEKMFEAQFFLILAKIMKIDVSKNEINPETRKLVQTVYKIRTDLRSSKQITAQKEADSQPAEKIIEQYPLYFEQIKEKIAFLTNIKFDFLKEKIQLNELSAFISNEMSLSDFFNISSQIQSSCSKLQTIFQPFLEMIKIPNFPIQFLSHFFQQISNNKLLLEILDAMSLFGKKDELQDTFLQLINYVKSLDSSAQIPIPSFLSFSALMILIISKNKESEEKIYFSIYLLFEFVCKNVSRANSNQNENENEENDNSKMFNTCFTFLCYFLRTLFDMNIINYSDAEMKKIEECFQLIPISNSFNFMISHSMMHAGFEKKQQLENLLVLLDTIPIREMHSYCLLLYEYFVNEKDSVKSNALLLLDKIGSTLTGCESLLLSESLHLTNISSLYKQKEEDKENFVHNCIKTSEAQINAVYELIILFRRILLTDSNASQSIRTLFSEIITNFEESEKDSTIVKRLIAVCSIISNSVNSFIPFSFIKNKKTNQKYFISELFNDWIVGVNLPITGILNFSLISMKNAELEPMYFLNYAQSMFFDQEAEEKLYHYILNNPIDSYTSSLISFFVLNCLRERIFDQDTGELFTHNFIQNMKQMKVDGFEYRIMNNQIISLIQKFLKNPDQGIFKYSTSHPSFHHCSFAQLTIEDNYSITDTHLISKKATNFFITNILDTERPTSFAVMVGPRQFPYVFFGFISHSSKLNHCFSILYNSTERGVLINGHESIIFENQKQIIEFYFDPTIKTVYLTSTNNNKKPLITMSLNDICSSFVAILPENTQIEYYLGTTTQTPCFRVESGENSNDDINQENSVFNIQFDRSQEKFVYNNDNKETYRLFKPKSVYSNYFNESKANKTEKQTYYTIKDDIINAAKSKSILQPMVGSKDKITEFFQFKAINLCTTIMPISIDKNVLFYSSKNSNIWSSSTNMNNKFLSIDKYDGYYELIKLEDEEISVLKAIKPFFYENLTQMPIDLINSYISGLSNIHRCEIITQLIIHAISDKEIPTEKTISLFSLDSAFFLNFIIKMLVIIEPFNPFNIKEGNSPINFEFNSISSRCTKPKFLNHHSAVCKILRSDVINNKKEFFNFWFKRLLIDFNSKSMHFVTKNNTDYIIVQRGIKQEAKEISYKDAIGYLVFPLDFGLRKMPKIEILNRTEKGEDEYVTYSFIEGNTIIINNLEGKFCFLPIFKSNASLVNSFIELVINFKYFIFFFSDCISSNLFTHKEILSAKIELRKQVYNAITSGSPFFYTHDNDILKFLNDHLPLSVSEFTEEYVQILNIFSLTSHTIPHPSISNFIQEQSLLFDDHKAEAYRCYFPEFCEQSDNSNDEINENDTKAPFKMPPITFPTVLNRYDPSTRAVLLSLKRVLQPRETIVNFPFHLVINEWAYYYAVYPPADIRIDTPCSLSITFTRYVPQAIRVIDRDIDLVDTAIEYSYSPYFANPISGSLLEPIPLNSDFLTVKFKITENVSQHNFIITSAIKNDANVESENKKQINAKKIDGSSFYIKNSSADSISHGILLGQNQINLSTVIEKNRDIFVSDMREMVLHWTQRDDQKILVHIKPEFFYRNNISPRIDPLDLAALQSSSFTSTSPFSNDSAPQRSSHLIALRSMLLVDVNWLCAQFKEVTSDGTGFRTFRPFISMLLAARNFRSLVENESNNGNNTSTNTSNNGNNTNTNNCYANLRINRRAGLDVRSGVSKRLDQSMIAQFAAQYRNPARFRSVKRPFHIEYVGENGIDVGGLARDFASELARDICEFRVGLFVATPNAKNKIGSFRECLIPAPDPRIKEPEKMYRAVGGVIAIGVRSGIIQPFNFPPFFWNYLAGEPIKVENVYEVDEVFKKSINSIEQALDEGMTPSQFDKSFARTKASFINFRGDEINVLNNSENRLSNNDGYTDFFNGYSNNNDGFGSYNSNFGSFEQRSNLITHANAKRFIALSIEYRVKELEIPMKSISNGFWENLNFKPPSYVSPELLEFVVCGERQVDLRQLRVVTQFTMVPKEEIAMFWTALGRMNSEQRRNFLQFATGSMCIPQNAGPFFLTVEYVDAPVDKRLPAAATCFNRIHLPPYSSVEKMLRSLITAIEYTGTFENS